MSIGILPLNHVKASDVEGASKYSIALLSTRRRAVSNTQSERACYMQAERTHHSRVQCWLVAATSACVIPPIDPLAN